MKKIVDFFKQNLKPKTYLYMSHCIYLLWILLSFHLVHYIVYIFFYS